MDRQHEEAENSAPRKRVGKYVLNTFAALLIGALGNGVWEALVRPGVGWLGDFMNAVASRFDSEVYVAAALDPTPTPSLFLLLILCTLPMVFSGVIVGSMVGSHQASNRIERLFSEMGEAAIPVLKRRTRRLKNWLHGFSSLALLVIGIVAISAFSVQNKSILVWRVFHANLDVIAQHVPDSERVRFKARFRLMRDRADFEAIKRDLDIIAKKNGQDLNWLRL